MRISLSRLAGASALLLLASSVASGQPFVPPTGHDPSRYRPGSVLHQAPLEGEAKLSLSDAIALGLRFNLNVEVERYAPMIAKQVSEGAWGSYDPILASDVGYDSNRTPSTSQINSSATPGQNSETFTTGGGTSLTGLVPYLGATLGISYDAKRRDSNVGIFSLRPEYSSDLFVQASVPLMRGLIWNQEWTNIKTSKLNYKISRENFRSAVMDTVQLIENAYWDLVATKEQLRVADTSLSTSEALLGQTKVQYEVGVVSRVEVVEAEAGVAERDFDRIRADNTYLNSNDALIDAILGPYLTGNSSLVVVSTDNPEDFVYYEIDVQAAVETAFAKRPDLLAARQEIERRSYDLKLAKNLRLPQLDVEARYGFVGKSGRCILGTPPGSSLNCDDTLEGGFSHSTDTFFTSRGADNLSVKALFSIPLGNRTASRRVTQREIELRRATTLERQLEQRIIVDVRRAARTLDAAQRGISASERRKAAAAEQLRAEKIRLQHGESTPFDVLLKERDFVEAESQNIGALKLYRNAVTFLNRQQGTILELNNVNIEEVAALR